MHTLVEFYCCYRCVKTLQNEDSTSDTHIFNNLRHLQLVQIFNSTTKVQYCVTKLFSFVMPSAKEPGIIPYFLPNLTNYAYAQNSNEKSLDKIAAIAFRISWISKFCFQRLTRYSYKRKELSPGRFSSLVLSCG